MDIETKAEAIREYFSRKGDFKVADKYTKMATKCSSIRSTVNNADSWCGFPTHSQSSAMDNLEKAVDEMYWRIEGYL